jgi:3-methyladenine DNA glycosylase AlkC
MNQTLPFVRAKRAPLKYLQKIIKQHMTEPKRKGARSIKDITPDIMQQLNSGKIESANLVEWLAIDQKLLLENVLSEWNKNGYFQPILSDINSLKKPTITTINEAIGVGLFKQMLAHNDTDLLPTMTHHASDAVRCWATYIIGKNPQLTIAEMLKNIQPFAADLHFGVREIAWMAVRPFMTKDLDESLKILSTWTVSENENIRRFASESTRPRGVWCAHIDALKAQPALALPILEPLKSDKAKYVQDSVGNWLNDASKTQPDFVYEICEKWAKNSPTKETNYIINKALRTLEK